MWRPLGWEKIIRDQCYDGDVVYKEVDTFEDGADAMLEALRKSGLATPIGHWVEAVSRGESSNKLSVPYDARGWLVFIPDEEEE